MITFCGWKREGRSLGDFGSSLTGSSGILNIRWSRMEHGQWARQQAL
jgi:hypothetical protein